MAVVTGTVFSVTHLENNGLSPLQQCVVLFSLAGTYAQADNGTLTAVPTAIQDSLRNGRTVTIVDAVCTQPARKASNTALMMGLKTIAISGADITFEVTESATANTYDATTELAAGAMPDHVGVPFGLLVTFTST